MQPPCSNLFHSRPFQDFMSVLHWLSPRLLDLFVLWLLVQLRPTVSALALFSQMPHNGTLVKGCKVRTMTLIPSNNSDNHIKGVRSCFRCSGLHSSHRSSLFGDTFGSTARNNLVSFFLQQSQGVCLISNISTTLMVIIFL